jgi:hypothetical protein
VVKENNKMQKKASKPISDRARERERGKLEGNEGEDGNKWRISFIMRQERV